MCNALDDIINPDGDGKPKKMSFEYLASEFNKRHGKFRGQGVGNLKEFLKSSTRFRVIEKKGKEVMVEQAINPVKIGITGNKSGTSITSHIRVQHDELKLGSSSSPPIPISGKCLSHSEITNPALPSSHFVESADQKLRSFMDDVRAGLPQETTFQEETDIHIRRAQSQRQYSVMSTPPDVFSPKSADSLTGEFDFRFDLNQSGCSISTAPSSHRASPTSDIAPETWLNMTAPVLEVEDNEDSIVRLIQKAPDDLLEFHESASMYIDVDNPLAFVQDIVSMWNMPFRGKAYIVLGVSPPRTGPPSQKDIKGIPPDQRRDNRFYQQLFSQVKCNSGPDFIYKEEDFDGKIVGVFTISNSHGRGEPCIFQSDEDRHLIEDIWCRSLSKNVLATGQLRSTIYKWFQGDLSSLVEGDTASFPITDARLYDMRLTESTSGETTPTPEEAFPVEKFLQATDYFDKKRSYCLVTNCHAKSGSGRILNPIGFLPWLKVFDFDLASGKTGVLAACQQGLKKRRNMCITTWPEEVRPLNYLSTEWFFPRGYNNKRESVCDGDDRQWNKKAGKKVDSHCQVLVEYCMARTPLTVVVLWYPHKGEIAFLDRFMRKLEDSLGSEMHAVLCCDKIAPEEKGVVDTLQKILRMEVIENLPLSVVCGTFQKLFSDEPSQALICRQRSGYSLPTYDQTNDPGISDVDAAWLASGLEVLYLNDPHTSGDVDDTSLGQEFYRGGALSWYEIRVQRFDVRRDSEEKLITSIDNHINKAKSALLTLNHAPGSGGSTLAKRVLWEVHRMGKAPCASVASVEHIKETVRQVDFLAEKTHLPIVLLIDGPETTVVRRIMRMLDRKTVIVLHVERQVSKMNDKEEQDKFQLHGKVSKDEAPAIAIAFQTGCNSDQHHKLAILAKRVQDGHKHCLYEFGIAAHARQYLGVQAYVSGYLELNPEALLNSWQRTVAYLALVTYYGYVSIPAHFFTAVGLLVKSDKGKLPIDMIPYNAKQFIIEEEDMGITKWRITHHIVANELLEQILNRTDDGRTCDENLSLMARKRLARLVSEFLKDASKVKLPGRGVAPPEIMKVLIATLIYRDSREIDVSQGDQPTRKPNLARLIRDIPSRHPYIERLEILKEFAECFPDDPSVWAHLGRFIGNFRPHDEEEARNCLERAITLRNQEIREENERFSRTHDTPYVDRKRGDVTLMKIYHMYGILQSREISRQTGLGRDRNSGSNFNFDPASMNQPNSKFHDKVEDIVKLCRSAVDHFVQCRDYVPAGLEESYGYVGEINVRLMVAGFVNDNYVPNGYSGYIACEAADKRCQEFLSECFSESNRLILECHEVVPQDELTEDYFSAVNWFNMLFNGAEKAIEDWHGWDSITSRRCRIAAYKLKHSKKKSSKRIHILELVQSEDDVKAIIELHEQNIREVFEKGMGINLDADMLEWLQAIRHEEFQGVYKFEEVLRFVRMWADTRRTPLAVYYLFVLHAILGLGSTTQGTTGSSRNFSEATKLLQELKKVSRLSSKPRLKRDWLGVYDQSKGFVGIKRLIRSYKILQSENNSSKPPWELEEKQAVLEARKGTISSSKKPLAGYIDVDDGFVSNSEPLKAFFIPKLTKFQGDRYRGQRVEFHVAFTMAHGLEAYNVSELKTYTCNQCKRELEMSRLGKKFQHCRCGFPIRRGSDSSM